MRILVVSEGPHELGNDEETGALVTLVGRLLGRTAEYVREKVSSSKVRVHLQPGKGGGYFKRALAWIRYAEREGFDSVILVIDQDGVSDRESQIRSAQEDMHFPLPRALGVAIRTFDAWILPDERALSAVLDYGVPCQPEPESIADPKKVCAGLLDACSTALSQTEMYAAVAAAADISIIERRCPQGFASFAHRVRQLAGE